MFIFILQTQESLIVFPNNEVLFYHIHVSATAYFNKINHGIIFAIYNFVYYAEQELRISSFYACYGSSLNLKFGLDQGQEQET